MGSWGWGPHAKFGETAKGLFEKNPRTERFNILGKVRENENELTTEKIRKIQNYLCLEDTGRECS